jgi:transposase, IS30 family
MGAHHMTAEQKQMARRLRAKGLAHREIAKDLNVTQGLVKATLWAKKRQVGRPDPWTPAPGRLRAEEREDILLGLARGESMSAIARALGRHPSTVTREVAANGGREGYGAWKGHCRAARVSRRPKASKLSHPPLAAQVSAWLERCWSPQEIAHRLRIVFPNDPMMHVSYETIYQSLYVQGKGELRRELARCLRSGRTQRRVGGPSKVQGHHANMVMISERPKEVEDRAVPGNWEGDLIMGTSHRSAVGTLVERTTRFAFLLHLPNGWDTDSVQVAMKKAIWNLPDELAQSITWDQGPEMAGHLDFTIDTGIDIYFCDPHSPWQRGSNENFNGLARQFMPKGTDLSKHSARDLAHFQKLLNERPRKTLGYMTPSEKLAELIAAIP